MAIEQNAARVHIIGAGLAGLSAAIALAEQGVPCSLVSLQPSEQAQSVLAEGGINGALDTMGQEDCPQYHFEDSYKAGCYLADPVALQGMSQQAPIILRQLERWGVPFHKVQGEIQLRSFGGQRKKRTAYADSSTGKSIMTALIHQARKWEQQGLIHRYPHHQFLHLCLDMQRCAGLEMFDTYEKQTLRLEGVVILAVGGMNGLFPSMTTGTTANTSDAVAQVLSQGVTLGNLEMIQYHPTTIGIAGKRCLVSEAARGEGGRLFVERDGSPWYFMEELHPSLGNLMPRDVIAREMFFRQQEGFDQVYLDLRHLPTAILQGKLSDLCHEVSHYMGLELKKAPLPVEPGIHYFMGGIAVDVHHRTNLQGLYAVGECCCQYHGANRLGGNSMLGAIYGGQVAARHIGASPLKQPTLPMMIESATPQQVRPQLAQEIGAILVQAMGIVRHKATLEAGLLQLATLEGKWQCNETEQHRVLLAQALVQSALLRKESRGAHYRADYPTTDPALTQMTVVAHQEEVVLGYAKKEKNTPNQPASVGGD